ncbi:hypothetical protein PybrP1_006958 [[Pythium] brassicae (nom. inval.)]|nr:hypothetical protein PybrP1_006958 [[Pythium] brassicae (nom. inval.)]
MCIEAAIHFGFHTALAGEELLVAVMPASNRGRWGILRPVLEAWERTQAELHGRYTLDRLKSLDVHIREVSPWQNVLVYLLTPVPCLVVVAVIDSFKLEPPENGIPTGYSFWLRFFLCYSVFQCSIAAQIQDALPALMIDTRMICIVTVITASAATVAEYGLAVLIGFPVPFTITLPIPLAFASFLAVFWWFCGDIIRSSAEIRKDVMGFVMVLQCTATIPYVYQVYAYGFIQLGPREQTAFVFLLPFIKIALKNAVSHFLGDQHDMKPETTGPSFKATAERSRKGMSKTKKTSISRFKVGAALNDDDTTNKSSSAIMTKAVQPWASPSVATTPTAHDASLNPTTATVMSPRQQQEDEGLTAELGLNALERLEFVQKTTKVLFMIEYAVLVEYAEVVTPVIYCTYMLLMYYLPNRAYYLSLAELSRDKLFANLSQVLLYATLELFSFLFMGYVIKRQLGITRTHQLTFVLKTQFRAVQAKFVLWVVFITQTYLFHFGADFSFQFKWLKHPST